MTDQTGGQPGDERSVLELEFSQRWCQMIDRLGGDGGQARVAKRLGWTTSTASRDYKGDTLPTDERLHQLCTALHYPRKEALALAEQLSRARSARRARLREPVVSPTSDGDGPADQPRPDKALDEPLQQPGIARGRWWKRRRVVVLGIAVPVVIGAVVTAVVLSSHQGQSTTANDPPVAVGAFPGLALDAVQIPVASLSPGLAAEFRQGRTAQATTVTGFVFRNSQDTTLCLVAANSGATAGQNRDPVLASACHPAPNEIWIPEQWEISGARFTRLVNDQYQSMCLNADNIGGLRPRHRVQLWHCYSADNESWDFGDWHQTVGSGGRSYPLFVQSGRLCLDADRSDLRDGTPIQLWNQYAASNEFWS